MQVYSSGSFSLFRAAVVLLLAVSSAMAQSGENEDRQQRGKRSARRTPPPQEQPAAAPQMVSPGFRYQHIRAGRRVFDILAQKAETYADQDLVLTGVDEIKIYGANGKISKLRADFGRWHNKEGDFELWGNVRGTVLMDDPKLGEELRFETEKLVYKEAWKAVTTLRPVLLETSNITTTGVGLNYNLLTQEVVIGAEVVTTMQLEEPIGPADTVVVTAGHLSLDSARRLAVYTQKPVLRMDQSQLSGEKMEFFFDEGEQRLEVEGQVAGKFHPESLDTGARQPAPPQPPVDVVSQRAIFHGPSRTATFLGKVQAQRPGEKLGCGRLVLLLSQQGHELESALAEDSVVVTRPEGRARGGRLTYRYATDEGLLSQQPELLLPEGRLSAVLIHFRRDGTILGENQVLLHHEPPKAPAGAVPPTGSALDLQGGAPVDITAERLTYAPARGFVVFEEKVRVLREGSRLEAQKLTLNRAQSGTFQSLFAETGVRLVTEGRVLTGDALHYDLVSRKALLEGQPAQARTAEEHVTAKAMSFSGASQDYSARESVSIQLLARASEPGGRRRSTDPQAVSATCGRAHFAGSGRRVELAEEVHLDKPDERMKLRSDEVDLYLLESRQISEMIARGGVQIQHAEGTAQGDLALYRSGQRQLEISGKAVQIVHQGRQSFPQRAVLHLDTQSVEFFGLQGLVRTILPIDPAPR